MINLKENLGKQVIVSNESYALIGTLCCFYKNLYNLEKNALLYFDDLKIHNEEAKKIDILFCIECEAGGKGLLKSINNSTIIHEIEIYQEIFTADKLSSNFGWVDSKIIFDYHQIDDNKAPIPNKNKEINNITCNRCNSMFANSSIGLICFKCGITSNDLIYKSI